MFIYWGFNPARGIEVCELMCRLILEDRDRQLESVKVNEFCNFVLLFRRKFGKFNLFTSFSLFYLQFSVWNIHRGKKTYKAFLAVLAFHQICFWPITYSRVQQDSQIAVMTFILKTWRVTSSPLSFFHHGYLRNPFLTFFVVYPDPLEYNFLFLRKYVK